MKLNSLLPSVASTALCMACGLSAAATPAQPPSDIAGVDHDQRSTSDTRNAPEAAGLPPGRSAEASRDATLVLAGGGPPIVVDMFWRRLIG